MKKHTPPKPDGFGIWRGYLLLTRGRSLSASYTRLSVLALEGIREHAAAPRQSAQEVSANRTSRAIGVWSAGPKFRTPLALQGLLLLMDPPEVLPGRWTVLR